MAQYRIKAQKTGPRTYEKELQLISYRGSSLFSDEGNVLISKKDVYYPPDYLASKSTAVVLDSNSYAKDGVSSRNIYSKGRPAALPIEEQFAEQSAVSRSLLGIDRAETQQGIFDDVSTYGLDRKDWVVYAGWTETLQPDIWDAKNTPSGPHIPARDRDYSEGSSVIIDSFPTPYTHPANAPLTLRLSGSTGVPGPEWGRYLQSLIAMYTIEYMVNNFSASLKNLFRLNFLEAKYPKTPDGKFNRVYWDQIWLDINQGRFESENNIPIMPQGTLFNMALEDGEDTINLTTLFGSTLPAEKANVSVNFTDYFFSSTRYVWREPNKGHYLIATNDNADLWNEYWGIDYNSLPSELRSWEFKVYMSPSEIPQYVIDYKLPYFLITSTVPSESLVFGESWPQKYTDVSIPQIEGPLANGNIIGSREAGYSVVTLTSIRAFRYQPGRISGFTYGVRISEEGAGPGSLLEWGVENYTDGYFFRLQDGTDFSVVRRSTIPLGQTRLFIEAQYVEREAYISQLTGTIKYKDLLTDSEVEALEQLVRSKKVTKVYETVIQQNQMNGDGLNGQGDSGYIFNPDTVTMYKIEFGWYGAIGARFYMYIPQENGNSRWVVVHTLVIENQLGQPCLEDPFFFFKYRVYVDSPSRIRLPQFVEKYGASYYIDGGDEGTVSLASGRVVNRTIPEIDSESLKVPVYDWATVLGLKPKQYIINSDGNSFPNKKEIFPVSMSITSTTDAEVKLVNQFGCRENAFVFQEGYSCTLPEAQRLRGIFDVNPLQTDITILSALGRQEDQPTPTMTYVGPDPAYPEASANLQSGGSFIGWNAYENSLMGSHLIGDKLYAIYLNPTQEYSASPSGISGPEIVIDRPGNGDITNYDGQFKNRDWASSELLFRYNTDVSVKLSRFRKDTTLLSTVDITTDEFYLLFTRVSPSGTDKYALSCNDDPSLGCDGSHFGEYQIGIVWPQENPVSFTYPNSMISKARIGPNFGIIDPKNATDRTGLSGDGEDTKILEVLGNYYVIDKSIPNSANYRYYEGLPVDFDSNELKNNVISVNQSAFVNRDPSGYEVSEGMNGSVGEVDTQFPVIEGADGGSCHALYGKAGEVKEASTFTSTGIDGGVIPGTYYLSKTSPWPSDLSKTSNSLFVVRDADGVSITVNTIVGPQPSFTPPGTNARLFLLPVTVSSGSPFGDDTDVTAKFRAIALYVPDLLRPDAQLISTRIVGQNLFPLRFFIRMKEGARFGAISIGQVTPNGIIQRPFTPHGCTLSVNNIDGNSDLHDGGSGDVTTSAKKSIRAFSEPDTLSVANYSYYDSSGVTGFDRSKKCPSFISRTILSGAGFSSTGDYPLRWLKFKESGDPLASFFVSANKPTEIDLSDVFGINTESVGPSFWNNKALFMIARNISTGPSGTMSVTFNYKEQ